MPVPDVSKFDIFMLLLVITVIAGCAVLYVVTPSMRATPSVHDVTECLGEAESFCSKFCIAFMNTKGEIKPCLRECLLIYRCK